MKCEKCKMLFPEKEIDAHHVVPKRLGGTDKDGRIHLCYECHLGKKGIHEKLKDELIVFTPIEIKKFTMEWLENG